MADAKKGVRYVITSGQTYGVAVSRVTGRQLCVGGAKAYINAKWPLQVLYPKPCSRIWFTAESDPKKDERKQKRSHVRLCTQEPQFPQTQLTNV